MGLKHRYAAVLAAFTVFIAGCSNNLVGRMAGEGKTEGTVTFSVTDIPSNYAEMIREAHNPPLASRSILPPSAPFATDTSGLTFVLTGKSNSGKTKEETIASLSGTTPNYSFKLKLEAYVWDLTLTAYRGAPADKRKVMEGHCTVDLTMGKAQADFKMSIKGIITPGTVKVTGSVTDTELVCTHYEIGIYNLYTGALVEKYTDVDGVQKTTHAKLAADAPSPATSSFPFIYEHTSPKIMLNAGAYEYRMVFYKGSSSDFKPIVSYSDTIVVYPGYDLEKDIGTLDVLNRKPTKPDQLRAYLENKSEDKEQDYCYVKLTWKPERFLSIFNLA